MATTILAIVAIIFIVVFVYFVYKYVINSSIQEILMRERNKHLLAIGKMMDVKESNAKQHVKKEYKTEEKSQSSTLKLTPIQEQERDKIINALNHHGGDLRKASARIGISHLSFYSKAKDYDLIGMIKKTSNVLSKLERQYHYIKLRQKGCSIIEAANALNVQKQTAERYELVYLNNK